MPKSKTRCIGILTSGGDCPGLNAAIRGVVKAVIGEYGMSVIGIRDGFRGLIENRTTPLDNPSVSGILTHGGTILGTSRDKPYRIEMGGQEMDMTATAVENARGLGIDCLVCLGGRGTQKNAYHLYDKGGLNVLTIPKTIDNDVPETDTSFGFDTAMNIAAEAIDRLHTTATSHQRIIVCELMGHHAGWLTLGAGIAGGADVILIPEIPYDLDVVAEHLRQRHRTGKRFSIVAVAEGAFSQKEAESAAKAKKHKPGEEKKKVAEAKEGKHHDDEGGFHHFDRADYHMVEEPKASRLARQLQALTGTEARVTTLGHVQRGGGPSALDRLLCTRLGTHAAQLLAEGTYNVMVAVRGDGCKAVSLKKVVAQKNTVPLDHSWISTARLVGTCLGDE